MGFKFTQAAFGCTKARGIDKLILWIICEHANEKNDNEAWPSINTLADEAGISRRSAIYSVEQLERDGLIEVIRAKIKTKNGKDRSLVNRYRPNLEAMGSASGALPPSAADAPPQCTPCTTLVHPVHHPSAPVAVEPVIEPGRETVIEPKVKSSQSVSQSAVSASPRLSVSEEYVAPRTKEKAKPKPDKNLESLDKEYMAKGYPLWGGHFLESSLVHEFYTLAGASSNRPPDRKSGDNLAAWGVLEEHRYDEILFVMRMVLMGKIPYYTKKGKRPYDFVYFAKCYPHARVLAEETLVAEAALAGLVASELSVPWNWQCGDWMGIMDSWNGDWTTCTHILEEGVPAFLVGAPMEACYLCGCPKDWKPPVDNSPNFRATLR